jgi:hypothetical protein
MKTDTTLLTRHTHKNIGYDTVIKDSPHLSYFSLVNVAQDRVMLVALSTG